MVQFSKLSGKFRFILIIVLSAVVVAGILAAAILVPPYVEHIRQIENAKSKIIRHTYRLVIDYRDRYGVGIPLAWTQDLELSDYELSNDNTLDFSVDNGRLYAPEGARCDAQATITFKLEGVLACIIYAKTVKADGYISTASEMQSLSGSSGTYIQNADILLEGQIAVADFEGAYYANHHVISGLDVGKNGGGLFRSARSATFSGIALTNITGEISASSGGSFGALVDSASYCTIEYCSAEGGFSVKDASGNSNIGGLAGYLLGALRSIDDDPNVQTLNSCTTNLQLSVAGAGILYVGGIAGRSDNVSVTNSSVRGKITVNIADACAIQKVYAGGILGSMYKEYNKVYQIHYLDFSHHLISYADIEINLAGGGPSVNTIYAGGAFGRLVNQSLDSVQFSGNLMINGGSPDLIVGGICAMAENEMYEIQNIGSIGMVIRASEMKGTISIGSAGRLYAGGLIGFSIKTSIESTVATSQPQTTVDRGTILTEISDAVGHAQS